MHGGHPLLAPLPTPAPHGDGQSRPGAARRRAGSSHKAATPHAYGQSAACHHIVASSRTALASAAAVASAPTLTSAVASGAMAILRVPAISVVTGGRSSVASGRRQVYVDVPSDSGPPLGTHSWRVRCKKGQQTAAPASARPHAHARRALLIGFTGTFRRCIVGGVR